MYRLHRSKTYLATTPRNLDVTRFRGATSALRAATNLLLALVLLAPASAYGAFAPKTREMLRKATFVGGGEILATSEYDDGRIGVVHIRIDEMFKPGKTKGPHSVRVVSITDEPGAVQPEVGAKGLLFVQPLRRTSYIDRHVPDSTSTYSFVDGRDGWRQARANQMEKLAAPIRQLVANSRGKQKDPSAQTAQRTITFQLISSLDPILVPDGLVVLAELPDLANSLSEAEVDSLKAALHSDTLPTKVRKTVISAIADNRLTVLADSLRKIDDTELQRDAWGALRRLGHPINVDTLHEDLKSEKPGVRTAAALELLDRDPEKEIATVSKQLLKDPDPEVRLEVIEALGATGSAQAATVLEPVFSDSDLKQRQATARALLAIGGPTAADSFHRLAFEGSIQAQRFAVFGLFSLGVGREDGRLQDIARRHTDKKIKELIEHGIEHGH